MRVDLLQRFTDLVGPPDAAVPLFECALLFSAALQDGDTWPEARGARQRLEQAAAQLCRDEDGEDDPASPALEAVHKVETVLAFLRELGFAGNIRDYENPRNSLMDRVLERRTGLPITLSVLAMHLAECCGVELHGVSFPGHFLVGLRLAGPDEGKNEGTDEGKQPGSPQASAQGQPPASGPMSGLGSGQPEPLIWDPFRGGRRLHLDELAALYTSVVGQHVEASSPQLRAQLRPCPSRLILTRMLENLRRHFSLAQQPDRVADSLELLAALHPNVPRIRELLAEHPRRRDLLN